MRTDPLLWGAPASRLGDLLLQGHPDPHGKPRVALSDTERRRIFAWMDLNVPYYGTSDSNHPDLPGGRRMWPEQLEPVLADVAARRCVACHTDGKGEPDVPRTFFLRISHPELNDFLLAPLAVSAGGTEACGRAVFAGKEAPDYQAILRTFKPLHDLLADTPREDMVPDPGSAPSRRCDAAAIEIRQAKPRP